MGGARLVGLLLLGTLVCATPAQANPYVQAHRGGPLVRGVPTYPENTMPAFRAAAAKGFVLEADVKLTADRVPVVFHDPELDRATNCSGPIAAKTFDQLNKGCRVDILGTDARTLPNRAPEPIPTLTRLLELVKATPGLRLNLEIKNQPLDSDFDPGESFATVVVDAVAAAKVPSERLTLQSFYPVNLDVAERRLPQVDTSLLTLPEMNAGAPAFAKARGYEWVSPGFRELPDFTPAAHAAGLRVVPYTIDDPQRIVAATRLGVDAIISNDPVRAREVVAATIPPRPAIPDPPSAGRCEALRAGRSLATVEAFHDGPGVRVFAMQLKQDPRHVVDHRTFRTKIECMVREHVLPRLAPDRPNVIAFNEDVGLATIATGTRGAAARDTFARPGSPSCEPQGAPCGTLAALALVRAGYSRELAAYRARFPQMSAIADSFVAPTDTFGRGWMQTFSDVARRHGVYILGSNNQAPLRESLDPVEIATFADPDAPLPTSVFVATRKEAYNEVFMWGPQDVRAEGPWPLRNVVAQNKKVPVTPIEALLEIAAGPATGADAVENVAPYAVPGTAARISFATSLPAFVYGNPPAGVDPCSDTSKYYMRCLDRLGANVVMQDEANPGRWASQAPFWQPLEWNQSTWRATADPTVAFLYNVTPHLVGNLADLAFDGQTAITQRGLGGPGCHYVGNAAWQAEDSGGYKHLAGPKPEFLAMLPWVAPDADRAALREMGAKLAPGSGDALENDYLEGAIAADLTFPPDPARAGCAGVR